MSAGKTLKATYKGRTYEIPEIWLAGFMQSNPGLTIPEAIAWWALQAEYETEWMENDR